MTSTLIKRICDPGQMTGTEKASVMAEKSYVDEADLKLSVHATLGVMQEIQKNRMPAQVMATWLTVDEYADANIVISLISDGTFSSNEVWHLCLLAEYGIYTCAQVESILGL